MRHRTDVSAKVDEQLVTAAGPGARQPARREDLKAPARRKASGSE
jgi:hypothetical protein